MTQNVCSTVVLYSELDTRPNDLTTYGVIMDLPEFGAPCQHVVYMYNIYKKLKSPFGNCCYGLVPSVHLS